jgi:hypothetical protein
MITERLTAQQLSGPPADSAEAVVERLLAVQAQDPRGARLTVRSRTIGLHRADVDDALTDRRSMLISWLNRGTLHLVTPDDYWLLHPLTTPQLVTGNRRRLRQEGVSEAQAEHGIDVIADAVTADGPLTRGELRGRLDAERIPTTGQALVHLLMAASLRGAVVRGPMRGTDHAFVAVPQWLGAPPAVLDRRDALAVLARRYLSGHGPADARDLAKWAGVTLTDARIGLDGIADEVIERDGLIDLADREPPASMPEPRLLGPFDPLLLGWVDRTPFVGPHTVVTVNGLFRACVLVDGRVVGTWGLRDTTLTVTPLEKISTSAVDALREDAADVVRFLGLPDSTRVVFDA